MPELTEVREFARTIGGLAVASTVRAGGGVQSSMVTAAVLAHPIRSDPDGLIAAFVTYGPVKLANLRARPALALTFTAGPRWVTVEGVAQLIGPDDPHPEVDAERLRLLLREVYTAAGGTHNDWDAYDAQLRRQRRVAVLITPQRVYGS